MGAGLIGLSLGPAVIAQEPGAEPVPPAAAPAQTVAPVPAEVPPPPPPPPAAAPAPAPSAEAPAAPVSPPPAAPPRPEGREPKPEAAAEGLSINFQDVELQEVIKNFSEILGKNFILEEVPKGKITIISPTKIPQSQAEKIFLVILNLNGYNIVQTAVPNLYRVVRNAEVLRSNIPIYSGGTRPSVTDSFVTRFIPLEYIAAKDVTGTIQPLLSKEGASAIGYEPTNTLILVDTALNIERIVRILKILDVPGKEPEMEIIRCKYTLASDLAATLGQIFSEAAGAGTRTATTAPSPAERASRARRRTPTPSAQPQTQEAGQAAGPPIKIIPETRINALIVIADYDSLQEVKRVIELLDIDIGESGTIHVYYLENADAAELASTLGSLSGAVRAPTAGERPSTRTPTGEMRAQPAAPSRPTPSGPVSATIPGAFEGEIKITADDATNSLIIVASPKDYELIKQVIAKLDIPRRQVFVEAVLLEVTLTKGRDVGTSLHAGSPLPEEGVVFGATSLSSLSSMTLLSQLSQGTTQLPSGMTVGALGHPITLGGTSVQIPGIGALVQLLASNSDVNVLSTPTILTTDNKEAEITVGQKIPVPTGQTISTGGLSSVSVSREEVGIKLRLTPQINESRTIRMDIYTEISGAVQSSLGINVNTLGVTTSLKTATTSVIVKDGQTIVIGGLMSDQTDTSDSRVPFLGDIPVFGWLFKSKHKGKLKSNLIILLTPHIVQNDEDIARVRAQIRKDYNQFVEESLGKKYPKFDEYFEPRYQEIFERPEGAVIDLTQPEPQVAPGATIQKPAAPPPAETDLFKLWSPEAPAAQPGATAPAPTSPPAVVGPQPGATVSPVPAKPEQGATPQANPPQAQPSLQPGATVAPPSVQPQPGVTVKAVPSPQPGSTVAPAPAQPQPGGTEKPSPQPGSTVAPAPAQPQPGGTEKPSPQPGATVAPAPAQPQPGGTEKAEPPPEKPSPQPGATVAPAPAQPQPGGTEGGEPPQKPLPSE